MQAKFITSGMDVVGDDPGLQSVEIATGTPASIISRPLQLVSRKYNAVAGNKHAITPASAIAAIPLSDAFNKCSAEIAPTLAASSAPPYGSISSA